MTTTQLVLQPKRQHLVSKVVLGRFLMHKHITVYDRQPNVIRRTGPRGAFYDRYDRFDGQAAEDRWGAIERKIPTVYAALDAGSLLEDLAAMETVRDMVALHWVRSAALRQAHLQVKENVLARSIEEHASHRGLLSALLTQQTGLVAAGQAELDWINRKVHRQILDEHDDEMFSRTIAEYFDRARAHLANWHVQIGRLEDLSIDLVIGDAPVLTARPGHPGVGPHQGVALKEATHIFMPVDPRIVIVIGPKPGQTTISAADALRHNALQRQGFVRWIGARPGGPSSRAMREHWPNAKVYV